MNSKQTQTLDEMKTGAHFVVCSVAAGECAPEWATWLEDLGFHAGERGSLMTRGVLGGDPLVVRIGLSTFALRRAEATCVLVQPVHAHEEGGQ